MASRLHSAATLCLWPPHERLTISTSEDNRSFLVQDVSGDGNCLFFFFFSFFVFFFFFLLLFFFLLFFFVVVVVFSTV